MTMRTLKTAPDKCDPADIFAAFNANFANKILTAAVIHLRLFEQLESAPRSFDELRQRLGLAERPARVLVTAMAAFGLVYLRDDDLIAITATARHFLLPSSEFAIVDYINLAGDANGVLQLVQSLRSDAPATAQYIKSGAVPSVMDAPGDAERLTEYLAGRARNCAPVLADLCPIQDAQLLVDVGGGTALFAIAYLQKHKHLRAIVLDRPCVLNVARKYAAEYGVADRLECMAADMFDDPFPSCVDAILLSNVLHDWGIEKCRRLVDKSAAALNSGGTLLLHDALLDDKLSGPLHVAMYSVVLFFLTEGRAYSEAEYTTWLESANLKVQPAVPTRAHCSVIRATK